MAVTLGVEGPRPQRRATVAFRVILAIPHFVLGGFVLAQVAYVLIVIAWFAALFTAQVPKGLADFLARILQYQTRMYAHGQLLLSDRFPPFDIGPSDYPVELHVTEPGRFNRWAVLFRGILQLPALFLVLVLSSGISVILFFVWLVTLISGRMPTSAHMAFASILRYQMRTFAYVGLVTTEYPHGLFGDREEELLVDGVDVDVDVAPPESPRLTTLVLSRAAKNLIILALVLGLGFTALNVAVVVSSLEFGTAAELDGHHDDLEDAFEIWAADAPSCAIAGGPECLRSANGRLAFALERFRLELLELDVPSGAVDELTTVLVDIDDMLALLDDLSRATDRLAYQTASFEFQDAAVRFDDHYLDLYDAVLFS